MVECCFVFVSLFVALVEKKLQVYNCFMKSNCKSSTVACRTPDGVESQDKSLPGIVHFLTVVLPCRWVKLPLHALRTWSECEQPQGTSGVQ